MKNQKQLTINCPICGAEYLPCEIYVPESFINQVHGIYKDHLTGKLECAFGESLNTTEHFICDHCNTPFKITAKVQFFTSEEENINFDTEYKTSLKKNTLTFPED